MINISWGILYIELRSNSSTCSPKLQTVQPKFVTNHLHIAFLILNLPLKICMYIKIQFKNCFQFRLFSLLHKIMWDILYKATKFIEIESKTTVAIQYTSWRKEKKKVMMTSHKMKWSKSFVPPQLFYFRNFPSLDRTSVFYNRIKVWGKMIKRL